METDARGQLGGLETTDAVRRRLASDSAAFKCATCARSNAEIIQESADRAKEADAAQDVEVPKELNMGYRDEMVAKKAASDEASKPKDDSDSAELAEGFVQTVQTPAVAQPEPASSSQSQPSNSAAQPLERHANSPTRTAAAPQRPPQRQQAAPGQLRQAQYDGVPVWVDRAIVALVILLSALVFKVLFGV